MFAWSALPAFGEQKQPPWWEHIRSAQLKRTVIFPPFPVLFLRSDVPVAVCNGNRLLVFKSNLSDMPRSVTLHGNIKMVNTCSHTNSAVVIFTDYRVGLAYKNSVYWMKLSIEHPEDILYLTTIDREPAGHIMCMCYSQDGTRVCIAQENRIHLIGLTYNRTTPAVLFVTSTALRVCAVWFSPVSCRQLFALLDTGELANICTAQHTCLTVTTQLMIPGRLRYLQRTSDENKLRVSFRSDQHVFVTAVPDSLAKLTARIRPLGHHTELGNDTVTVAFSGYARSLELTTAAFHTRRAMLLLILAGNRKRPRLPAELWTMIRDLLPPTDSYEDIRFVQHIRTRPPGILSRLARYFGY